MNEKCQSEVSVMDKKRVGSIKQWFDLIVHNDEHIQNNRYVRDMLGQCGIKPEENGGNDDD